MVERMYNEAVEDLNKLFGTHSYMKMLEMRAREGKHVEMIVHENASAELENLAEKGLVKLFYTPEKVAPVMTAQFKGYNVAIIPDSDRFGNYKKPAHSWNVITGYLGKFNGLFANFRFPGAKEIVSEKIDGLKSCVKYEIPVGKTHEVFTMIRSNASPKDIESIIQSYKTSNNAVNN